MGVRVIHQDLLKYLRDYQAIVRGGYMPLYHAVLCDPPYYLGSIVKRFGGEGAVPAQHGADGRYSRLSGGFMGQTWDGFESPQDYQAWVTEWARLMLDFVYPGGVLMAFGGTRTYHRLVCGLEDAGWEIYDSVMVWTYGSGFPKSHDINKGIEKQTGSPDPAWDGYGSALKPSFEPIVLARRPRDGYTYADCAIKFGSGALNIDGGRIAVDENDSNKRSDTGGYHYQGDANEFLPMNSTRDATLTMGRWPANTMLVHHPACRDDGCHAACHVRVLGEQSGVSRSSRTERIQHGDKGTNGIYGYYGHVQKTQAHADEGTVARYFYQAKASQWERDAGLGDMALVKSRGMRGTAEQPLKTGSGNERNNQQRNPHPTVKPIKLIEQIARLIKPAGDGGRLLVPFAGSGSEMIGAHLAGWKHITGIEMTDAYIPIARARLAWWRRFDNYAMAEAHHKKHDDSQMTLFEVLERDNDGFLARVRV